MSAAQPSLKKTTREKINTVAVKTLEELTGSQANEKAKKRIAKKSRKLSKAITTLLKKENKKKLKAEKAVKKKAEKAVKQEKKSSEKKPALITAE